MSSRLIVNRLVVQGKVNTPCKCTKILEVFCKQRVERREEKRWQTSAKVDYRRWTRTPCRMALLWPWEGSGEAREGWRDATMKVGFRSEEFKTILLSSLLLQTVVDMLLGGWYRSRTHLQPLGGPDVLKET